MNSRQKYRINLIWMSLFFAIAYWLLESVRSSIVYTNKDLIYHLFTPDAPSILMRVMTVVFLFLFGLYAHLQKKEAASHIVEQIRPRVKENRILWIGIAFAMGYWVLESLHDFMLFREGSLLKYLISPNIYIFGMRVLTIGIMILFSAFVQYLINSRKSMMSMLQDSNKQLQELDHKKDDYLSVVSHELKTPIAIIREGVSICLEKQYGSLNEFQTKMLSESINNIDRLNRLVTDLLDIGRIEAGKVTLRKRMVDLCRIVREVYEHYKKQCEKKGIELVLALPETQIKVFADEDKVLQIFNNLLSNALRYTEPGGTISLSVREDGEFIQCGVRDTGAGIASENIDKLFSKYGQVGQIKGQAYKGTGLGLAISKGLVEKHGGSIHVISELGQGSDFIFTIRNESAPKILIIDDEPSSIELIKHYLMDDDYEIIEALDGVSGLKAALESKPSLVILDIILPGMNGYEVLGRMKNDVQLKDIPVILISASSIDHNRVRSRGGTLAFPMLQKPLEKMILRERVREVLAE